MKQVCSTSSVQTRLRIPDRGRDQESKSLQITHYGAGHRMIEQVMNRRSRTMIITLLIGYFIGIADVLTALNNVPTLLQSPAQR